MKHIQSITMFNESLSGDFYQKVNDWSKETSKLSDEAFSGEEIDKLIKSIGSHITNQREKNKDFISQASMDYCDKKKEVYSWDFIKSEVKFFGIIEPIFISNKIPEFKLGLLKPYSTFIYISKKVKNWIESIDINVYKKEDEWFFVKVQLSREIRIMRIETKLDYYKCDQLVGLTQLIKDLIK
jgi:hypothetical protein